MNLFVSVSFTGSVFHILLRGILSRADIFRDQVDERGRCVAAGSNVCSGRERCIEHPGECESASEDGEGRNQLGPKRPLEINVDFQVPRVRAGVGKGLRKSRGAMGNNVLSLPCCFCCLPFVELTRCSFVSSLARGGFFPEFL